MPKRKKAGIDINNAQEIHTEGDIVGGNKIIQYAKVNGMTYADAKQIAQDVFEANFYRLSGAAVPIANERARKFADKFFDTLALENPEGVISASDPDMQYSLFSAQQEYVKSGEDYALDLLVGILVERTKIDKSSLLHTLLREAAAICPKLLAGQIDFLTLLFIMRYVKFENKVVDIIQFYNFLNEEVLAFAQNAPRTQPYYWHLRDTGCITINEQESTDLFERYHSYFASFVETNLQKQEWESFEADFLIKNKIASYENFKKIYVSMLHKTNNSGEKFQMIATNSSSRHFFSDTQDGELIKSFNPALYELIKNINSMGCGKMNLTSLGIVIANANLKRVANKTYDISEWVS